MNWFLLSLDRLRQLHTASTVNLVVSVRDQSIGSLARQTELMVLAHTGEKFPTQINSRFVVDEPTRDCERRINETMFSAALLASIHSKPAGSPSASQSEFFFGRRDSDRELVSERPRASGSSSKCQSRLSVSFHSRHCPNSPPINKSFLPGCAHMYP